MSSCLSRPFSAMRLRPLVVAFANVRLVSTAGPTERKPDRISKNLSFRPAVNSLVDPAERPLAIIYSWLVAKARHIYKYGDFYLGKGFDVLHIKIDPGQCLQPKKAQTVIQEVLDFTMDKSHHSQPLLIHGFSVGGYLYGETLVKITSDPSLLDQMQKRIKGQIFDSPVDLEGLPYGFSRAITNNSLLQNTLQSSIELYLRLAKESLRHYKQSSSAFHANAMNIPSLLLYSQADLIAAIDPIERATKNWQSRGIDVFTKKWENSGHVSHFHHNPVQYIGMLNAFLQHIKLCPPVEQADREHHGKQQIYSG